MIGAGARPKAKAANRVDGLDGLMEGINNWRWTGHDDGTDLWMDGGVRSEEGGPRLWVVCGGSGDGDRLLHVLFLLLVLLATQMACDRRW